MVEYSSEHNRDNILDLIDHNTQAKLLDLGCDDGSFTTKLAGKLGVRNSVGIEINDSKIESAKKNGVDVIKSDLNEKFPFSNDTFEVVHSNQVIEHILNLEGFIKEIYRVLKPEGYAIVSTENLASWHNIFPLIFGWQPFSITNYLPGKNLGNPFSLHIDSDPKSNSWCHDKLWAYNGLKQCFISFGFEIMAVRGAGYYPLPSFLGNIDKRHCHWITFKIKKRLF